MTDTKTETKTAHDTKTAVQTALLRWAQQEFEAFERLRDTVDVQNPVLDLTPEQYLVAAGLSEVTSQEDLPGHVARLRKGAAEFSETFRFILNDADGAQFETYRPSYHDKLNLPYKVALALHNLRLAAQLLVTVTDEAAEEG
jgi:hypothetical protein